MGEEKKRGRSGTTKTSSKARRPYGDVKVCRTKKIGHLFLSAQINIFPETYEKRLCGTQRTRKNDGNQVTLELELNNKNRSKERASTRKSYTEGLALHQEHFWAHYLGGDQHF